MSMLDASPKDEFEQATVDYLAMLYETEPVMATAMGVHDYDGRLPNLNQYAIDDRLREVRGYLHRIDKISLVGMDADSRTDIRLARSVAQMEIVALEQIKPYQTMPTRYLDEALTGLSNLIIRDFAPVAERAESLLSRLYAIPELFKQARENLGSPPAIYTEIAVDAARGGIEFFDQTLASFVGGLQSEALAVSLAEAAARAKASLCEFIELLAGEVMARSTGDFAIGEELFDYALRVGHVMDETGCELEEIGRETIQSTKSELSHLAATVDGGRAWPEIVEMLKSEHPLPEDLLAAYRAKMEQAREFIGDHGILTIPGGENLTVEWTPPYLRGTYPYAAYLPAAPFEEVQQGIFYVTPIDTTRSSAEQEIQLQGHSSYNIPVIAIHEGYPGHHLQFSCAAHVPSRFRRHFGQSNLFCEGWALYCEEMMHEMGFYSDPRIRLMQLKNQLWRACRVIIDVGLHTRRMTIDDAVQMLVSEAKLEETHARAEVRRYTLNPTQPMTYIMGKRAIQGLRQVAERRMAGRFALRRFHDELLYYGTIPPRLIRDAMTAV